MNLVDYIKYHKSLSFRGQYWTTIDNIEIPFFALQDRHLSNIPHYLFKKYKNKFNVDELKKIIPKGIIFEIESRGMEIDYLNGCKVHKRIRIKKEKIRKRRFNPYW